MKRVLIAFAAVALALVSCNREPAVQGDGSEVRFTSNIENTFSVKGGEPMAVGKTVRIIAGAPIGKSTNAVAAAGNVLTPETPIKWKEGQQDKTTFVGIYPSHEQTETTISAYKLVDDYGVQDFDYHNNFLVALAKDVNPGATVNLEFRHPFVKLVLDVDNQLTGAPAVTGATVSDVYTEANLVLDAGTIVPASAKGVVPATKNATTGKFEVIIMPQDAKPVIKLSVGTATFTFTINTITTFVAGKSYTASLVLKDTTPPDGDPVAFTFSVTDWADDPTPLATTDVTGQWSVVGDVTGGWDVDLPLVEGATPGILEATITYALMDEFKLRLERSWTVSAGLKDGVDYVGGTNWDGHLAETSNNIKLQEAGQYKITFAPDDEWKFTAIKIGD